MADGDTGEATLDAYADAQARFELAGGYRWRDEALATVRGLGFGDAELDRPLVGVLRRRADPRLARPGPRLEARPAAPRRADQPPRHRVARVARALPDRPRRGGDPRRARSLVPRVGRHLGARARGRPGAILRRPVARMARRARGARARRRARRRAPPGRDRAHGAVRRALPLQGDEGAPGAVEAEGDRPDQGRRRRAGPARSGARSRSSSAPPSAPGGSSSSSRTRRVEIGDRTLLEGGELWLEREEHVTLVGPNGCGKSTLLETLVGGRAARERASSGSGTTSTSATSRSTPRSPPTRRRPCSPTPSTGPGSRRRRPGPCSAASCSRARRR